MRPSIHSPFPIRWVLLHMSPHIANWPLRQNLPELRTIQLMKAKDSPPPIKMHIYIYRILPNNVKVLQRKVVVSNSWPKVRGRHNIRWAPLWTNEHNSSKPWLTHKAMDVCALAVINPHDGSNNFINEFLGEACFLQGFKKCSVKHSSEVVPS